MAVVASEEVAAYQEMVEAHARRFTRLPEMGSHFDDFVQEGLIAVWEALRDGHYPSNLVVIHSMKDYAKIERRKGLSGFDELTEDLEGL